MDMASNRSLRIVADGAEKMIPISLPRVALRR